MNKILIGRTKGKEMYSCFSLENDVSSKEFDQIVDVLQKSIEECARFEDDKTNPGVVILSTQPEPSIYHNAVTSLVSLKETVDQLKDLNAFYKGYKNKRGLIGAIASVAWIPGDKTYEIITYREKQRWGTPRYVDVSSVMMMDNKTLKTFDNFDYHNNHSRITPNSPCPILYGIRGDDSDELLTSIEMIDSEAVDGFLLFETNQGTDDHIQKKNISDISAYESVCVRGTVVKGPYTVRGGHVIFRISDGTCCIDCACYEPTKQFRDTIRSLVCGDVVDVFGGVRSKPLTINIEKIYIVSLVKIVKKIENPVCISCGKHMKSVGENKGFRCKRCGTKSCSPVLKNTSRSLSLGWYESAVCARRHLSKPLKRFI
ncbi:MAG: tRNA(Ile)(2)-agmatinylcytidine synthase [Thermoplasmatota archaeon]